jgi:hypothetical protein
LQASVTVPPVVIMSSTMMMFLPCTSPMMCRASCKDIFDAEAERIRAVSATTDVLIVEHDMDVVFGLADKIAVMDYGHVQAIDKTEAVLDWQQPAALLERRLRAFDPFPGGSIEFQGQPLKVWRARVLDESGGAPGTWLAAGEGRLVVACGEGTLELLEVQPPGGRRLTAREFLQRQPRSA